MADKKSNLKLIEQICDIMDKRNLAEVELTEGQVSVKVRRANTDVSPMVTMATTIPEQLVENATAVEFDQPLFRIRRS